jgi:FkbM family methyltransferase
MKRQFKRVLKSAFKGLGAGIVSIEHMRALEEYEKDVATLLAAPASKLISLVSLLDKSKSQLRQDLFVLAELDFKENGYFVEFGATNGVDLSNTHILEKEFGWNGILAEPAKCWHGSLTQNRRCNIEFNCVWADSQSTLNFSELDAGEFSTITAYSNADLHGPARVGARNYDVRTISMNDLLRKYNAPNVMDYLSIDTEGSEWDILSNLDFDKYQFRIITCEHNFTPMRQKIMSLLTKHGYARKYIGFSKWDDWYVRAK